MGELWKLLIRSGLHGEVEMTVSKFNRYLRGLLRVIGSVLVTLGLFLWTRFRP